MSSDRDLKRNKRASCRKSMISVRLTIFIIEKHPSAVEYVPFFNTVYLCSTVETLVPLSFGTSPACSEPSCACDVNRRAQSCNGEATEAGSSRPTESRSSEDLCHKSILLDNKFVDLSEAAIYGTGSQRR